MNLVPVDVRVEQEPFDGFSYDVVSRERHLTARAMDELPAHGRDTAPKLSADRCRGRGRLSGRGPRVLRAREDERRVSARRGTCQIAVTDGKVILTGEVRSRFDREAIQGAVRGTPGGYARS